MRFDSILTESTTKGGGGTSEDDFSLKVDVFPGGKVGMAVRMPQTVLPPGDYCVM